ncbi:curli-like amyloid fiber formation chaperone CsgH [Methyloferula stellata]|uniref:curli-like amyloid fiber formation chaperone CsgH n=1 Tax=Methyloferula stellata TaxID=876270 RepID=UPI003CC74CBD
MLKSHVPKHRILSAICAPALLLCADGHAAFSLPAAHPSALECQIRVSAMPNGLRLEAVANARASVTGRYRLSVAKDSASGSSQNLQSGDFKLDVGQQRILSTLLLDSSAIGHYRATLSLEWEQGHESCSSP